MALNKNKVGSWLESGQKATSAGYADVGDRFKDYGERGANLWQTNQDWGLGELQDIYAGIGSGGGGGGVPGYQGEFDADKAWWENVKGQGYATPEQKDAGWGWGTFKNFAETGGWSPDEMSDFRARSTSGIPSMYGGLRDEMVRGKTIQGGYGPGYGTAQSQLARDRARSMGEASLGAETSLANSIRQGKQWGGEQGKGAAQQEYGNMAGAQNQLTSIAEKIAAANRAARSSRAGAADRDTMMRLGLIDRITGLSKETGSEIPYAGVELNSYGGRASGDTGYANSWGTMTGGPSKTGQILGGAGKVAAAAAPVIIAL